MWMEKTLINGKVFLVCSFHDNTTNNPTYASWFILVYNIYVQIKGELVLLSFESYTFMQ